MSLKTLTDEERTILLQKTKESLELKRRQGESLKNDFSAENHWKLLFSSYGITKPRWYIPNTETKYLKRAMKKVGVDPQKYLEDCGCRTIKELVELNPDYPAYAEIGFFLEWCEEEKK